MTKGFLLGSALILLALIILGLSFTLSDASRERNSGLLRFSVFDRIDDEVKATQNGYGDILSEFIKISVQGNNVTFSETLPDKSSSSFFTAISGFKTFIESNSSFGIKVNLAGITDEMPLIIKPVGVLYNHPHDFGDDRIEITTAQQVIRYNITVLLNKTGATPVEWSEGPVNDVQGLQVYIETGGLTGNDFTFSGNLSRTELSRLKIKIPGDDMTIDIGDSDNPGRLRITNDNSNTVALVNTTVTLNASSPYVVFPDQTINITAAEYNISKIDAVRVA